MKKIKFEISFFVGLFIVANIFVTNASFAAPSQKEVINTYSDIALAGYEDSLKTAEALKSAIDDFLKSPTEDTLDKARKAWISARVPYMQTEAFRFGNAVVDDWEGRVNAWPLDEGMIDYVTGDYDIGAEENELYVANIIATKKFKLSGREIDASTITKKLIIEVLHEAGGVEGNVATGYHAIEFLLWGQDLNGTKKGRGQRPASDFNVKSCTGGNCDRRIVYLKIVTDLLIEDLRWMIKQWGPQGAARATLLAAKDNEAISAIFTGIGSLSYGELAGERMKLGLILHDPEEEHDCFSDNTHNSHYYNALGIQNVYLGRYKRIDGTVVSGPSISDLVKASDEKVDANVKKSIEASMTVLGLLKKRAETTEAYDQMLAEGNKEGNEVVSNGVQALVKQTKELQRAIAVLKLKAIDFESSDSLDNPSMVGKDY